MTHCQFSFKIINSKVYIESEKMKKVIFGIILLTIVIGALISFYTKVSCWNLFNPFKDTKFSTEGLKRAVDFDPDEYIQYLPELNGKDFFESIEELSICRRSEVRKYIYIYLTRSRKYTIKAINRSRI